MEKSKKIKLYIGFFYLLFIGIFLYYFFSKFSLQEIGSYDFIKNNRDYFFKLKNNNTFLISTLFLLFTIIWVLAAGFGAPIAFLVVLYLGQWMGVLIVVLVCQ